MSEVTNPIQAKRQAALVKLRDRRGESRQPIFASRQDREKDRLSLIVKAFQSLQPDADQEEVDEETLLPPMDHGEDGLVAHPDVPLIGGEAAPAAEAAEKDLPRLRKAQEEVADRDETARAAIATWRSLMKARRERQQSPSADPPPLAGPAPEERRQMFFDLLTIDFLENTRIWISANADSLDLSSTPRDEVDRMFDRAVYRRKVLEELGKMNEQEIDALTTYLHAVQVHAASRD